MLMPWITVSLVVLIAGALLFRMIPAFRESSLGWRLLAVSGISLAITGINFILRFWHPTAGPYRANEIYPYGTHLQTWAVSFGFAWLAFGLLFTGLSLLGSKSSSRDAWLLLLGSWFLCWLPHGLIGVAFAWAGRNEPSISAYREWGSEAAGFALLLFNALTLLVHFGASVVGFFLTGLHLLKARGDRNDQ